MAAKEKANIYTPIILDYVNQANKWLTTGEIATRFNLNLIETSMYLNILVNNYYIKKKKGKKGIVIYHSLAE